MGQTRCYFSLKICCKINVFIRHSGHIPDAGTKNTHLETAAGFETVSRGTGFITTHCAATRSPSSSTRKPRCHSVTSIHFKSLLVAIWTQFTACFFFVFMFFFFFGFLSYFPFKDKRHNKTGTTLRPHAFSEKRFPTKFLR